MSNRDLLARITTNKPGALALTCRVVLVAAAVLLVDFVVAEPLLAEPVRAKDEPKYVGDFYSTTTRKQVQIIDDGPSSNPFRRAPIVVVPASPDARSSMTEAQRQLSGMSKPFPLDTKSVKSETPTAVKVNPTCDFKPPSFNFPPDLLPGASARPQVPEPQSRISPLGKEYAAVPASSARERARFTPTGPIGDFPLKKLNFPREIGPAGKYALPMTASPRVMSVPAKPMGVGGAARKGEAPRLHNPTNRRARAVPIQTYSTGYVPGSTSTEHKSKGLR
ncbi:MAG: hypothetical protein Q8T09_19770 [Candidatus Melainabacteria bacterium]|nr:hypothetical protein [Candidatus Melainabacteria bacterium]